MIKNYFKTALRKLIKDKSYSFLNIAGLAIGIACASLILLWVQDELSYNHNFPSHQRLFTIYENQVYDGKTSTFRATPGPMARSLQRDIPGIKTVARTSGEGPEMFSVGDKSINENGSFADRELIDMLDLNLISGDRASVLKDVNEIVINETMAKKFFGTTDVAGRMIKYDNRHDLMITGVFKDLPENSTFKFQWLAPMAHVENKAAWQQSWSANWVRTYVELEESTDVAAVNARLERYLNVKSGNKEGTTTCFLFAMDQWNLYNNFVDGRMEGGRITYVKLFSTIAWIILLIACINFMNLSTARANHRGKEVGVRKVMGAGKNRLIAQFISEAIVMSFVALGVAVAIVYVALPSFNTLVEKNLNMDLLQPAHLIYLLSIGIVTGLLAGSYPAFYMSSFNPIIVLKNLKAKTGGLSAYIRQGLVVTQFTASIILIIGTIIIYQQIQHVKARSLGMNKNNLVYTSTKGKIVEQFSAIRNELRQTGLIESVALSEYPALSIWNNSDNFSWQGKDARANPLITWECVSSDFTNTLGMKLVAGNNFHSETKLDTANIIINEAFAKQMGAEGKPGGIVHDGSKSYTIIGVVKDFLYNDMYASAAPLILYHQSSSLNYLNIRFKDGVDVTRALEEVRSVLQKNNPGFPVDYTFVDDDFTQLFKTETLTGKLAGVFAVLAIFISCLGLFGLAAYTAERRIKEIGIRKVLGATTAGLVSLLSRDFIRLVGLACVIAFPIAYWAVKQWLQNYQYRIEIQGAVFIAAGSVAILIAITTVSFQAIKAAVMNPVKSLRNE